MVVIIVLLFISKKVKKDKYLRERADKSIPAF